jgi:hypothetical protein
VISPKDYSTKYKYWILLRCDVIVICTRF